LYRDILPNDPKELAKLYDRFMEKVSSMSDDVDATKLSSHLDRYAYSYFINSRGASTDFKPRTERLNALKEAVLKNEDN
jgi:hypothetical protein